MPQIPEQAEEEEEHAQSVLALRNPSHRLNVHRMHGEDQRRQPGARQAQPFEHLPQQAGTARMKKNIDEVIPRGVHPPEPPLQPE